MARVGPSRHRRLIVHRAATANTKEMTDPDHTGTQLLNLYRSDAFAVTAGAAEGDPLVFADELIMDDIYGLLDPSLRGEISVTVDGKDAGFAITPQSSWGAAEHRLYLDSCITFMTPDGTTQEAIIFVEVGGGIAVEIYLLPLAEMHVDTDYRLVGIDRTTATRRFAEAAFVSFAAGTRITLASGEMRAVEDLAVGDRVLTRDDGPRAIRWIGHTTFRATGTFAPVSIAAGVLHNDRELRLSPDHRIFVYQRSDNLGAGRPEVLIKARNLVNGTTIQQTEGGFIDYYQLLFDDHHIIYAEGIAAESLMIDPRTTKALPDDIRERLAATGGIHERRRHHDYEIAESLVGNDDIAELLRRASQS